MIYDNTCDVYRIKTTLNPTNNRPVKQSVKINEFPYTCRLGKRTSNYVDGSPNSKIDTSWRLYLPFGYDIQEGDIIELNTLKYIIENVYTPNNHHIECDVIRKVES